MIAHARGVTYDVPGIPGTVNISGRVEGSSGKEEAERAAGKDVREVVLGGPPPASLGQAGDRRISRVARYDVGSLPCLSPEFPPRIPCHDFFQMGVLSPSIFLLITT